MSQKQKVKKTSRKSIDEKISDIIGSEPSPTLEIDLDDIPTPKSTSKEDKTRLSQIPPLASSLTFEDDEEIVVKKSKKVFATPSKRKESKKIATPSTSKQKTPAKPREKPTPAKSKTLLQKTPLKPKPTPKSKLLEKKAQKVAEKKKEKKKVEKKQPEKKQAEKQAEEKIEEKKSEEQIVEKEVEQQAEKEKEIEKQIEEKETEEKKKPEKVKKKKKEKVEGEKENKKKKKKQKTTNIKQGFLAQRTKLDGSIAEAIDLMNGVEHVIPKAAIHKMISQAINELEVIKRPRVSFSALATLHESIEHEALELIYTAQILSKFMNPKAGSLSYKALVLAEMYRKRGLHLNAPKEELDKLMKEAGFEPVIEMVEAPPVKEKKSKKRKKDDDGSEKPRKKAKVSEEAEKSE